MNNDSLGGTRLLQESCEMRLKKIKKLKIHKHKEQRITNTNNLHNDLVGGTRLLQQSCEMRLKKSKN